MSALADFHEYLESDAELYYQLRIGHDWDESAFEKLMQLLTRVLSEYREANVIPKAVVYFLVNGVDRLEALVSNELFYGNVPSPYTKEAYKALVAKRVSELKDLKRRFINGEL